jgi:hypothetical protein
MDVGQCARHGTGLLLATVAAWFAHNTTLTDEYDMTVREFLLKLTSQSTYQQSLTEKQKAGLIGHTVVGFC